MNKLMHGYDFAGQDVSGWWASEKLDGLRCLWNGSEYVSRNGMVYRPPAAWFHGMPQHPLDGELWGGVGSRLEVQRTVAGNGDWSRVYFRPFDIPQVGQRIEDTLKTFAEVIWPAHVLPIPSQRVDSVEAAIRLMGRIVTGGGEGVMLRKPGSAYSEHRTEKLLKMTPAILAVSVAA
jgi:DNA ligase 1